MKSFGVKDTKRYAKWFLFVTLKVTLENNTFSQKIIIIDEVHKLIDYITNSKLSPQTIKRSTFSLSNAYKILALIGTPVYNSPNDSFSR